MRVWKTRLSILLVCQLLLAGGLWALSHNRETSKTQATNLLALDKEAITKIEIAQGEKTFVLAKSDGRWVLPDYHELPAAQADVESLLSGLDDLSARAAETTTESSHQRLGVSDDKPEGRLKLYAGETLVSDLLLGKSPTFNQRFVRVAEKDEAFKTEWQGLKVQAKGTTWLDKTLLASGSVRKFIHPEFELTQESGEWTSGQEKLDSKKVVELLSSLEKLMVVDVVNDLTPGQTMKFEVENSGGTTYAYSYFENDGKHYLMRNDHDLVFQIRETVGKALAEASLENLKPDREQIEKE
jgi:uncharacterized protein DUF4340